MLIHIDNIDKALDKVYNLRITTLHADPEDYNTPEDENLLDFVDVLVHILGGHRNLPHPAY